MRMKMLITAVVVLALAGCASSDFKQIGTDENLRFFLLESGVGPEGGPVMKQLVGTDVDEKTGKRKIVYRDTHSSAGTAQQLANTTVGGGLAIIREKERAPFSVSGDNTTTFNVDGSSSQAAAMSESSNVTDVDIGDGDDIDIIYDDNSDDDDDDGDSDH